MHMLSKILKDKRKELKLSLRKAAQLIGISHSYLSNLEKGIDPNTKTPINPTPPETLQLISDAYKIDYNELMIAAGYVVPDDITVQVYDNTNIDQGIEDMLNYYRSQQFANMLLSLSPKTKKELLNIWKLKLLEDNNLDIEE